MDAAEESLCIFLGIGEEVEAAVIERKLCPTLENTDARTTKRVVDSCDLVEFMGHHRYLARTTKESTMAGVSAERQENAVIKAINDAVRLNKKNPVSVIAGDTKLTGVISAEKYTGRQQGGAEPYTDVVISCIKNKKKVDYKFSLKGEEAASLAGGGLKGLELIIPGIGRRFMNAAYEYLVENKNMNSGDKVPDIYGKISGPNKSKIVRGNQAIGGPIDYMYIGSMTVSSKYDSTRNTLTFLNGKMIDVETYARTHELYFRLRARRIDQRFDPSAKDGSGTPKIYGKSPSRGDSAGRIVITDDVPRNAEIVTIR